MRKMGSARQLYGKITPPAANVVMAPATFFHIRLTDTKRGFRLGFTTVLVVLAILWALYLGFLVKTDEPGPFLTPRNPTPTTVDLNKLFQSCVEKAEPNTTIYC